MPYSRKQNVKISIKKSEPNLGLDLKGGEVATDGENLYIGQVDRIISVSPPLGVIIFWNNFGFGTTENGSPSLLDVKIPAGWRIANGERISDPNSPYDGYYLPNLTGDIFLQGSNLDNIGITGGTNDYTHKHNIAHHHILPASAVIGVADHTHGYTDVYVFAQAAAEDGGTPFSIAGNDDIGRGTYGGGAHNHLLHAFPVADQSSGLYVNSNNHLNQGNPRTLDDVNDFIDNRPKYLSGIFLIRIV